MKYSINEINNELESKIYVNDDSINKKLGRIKKGDLIIIDKDYDDVNIKKYIRKFGSNYLNHNMKTLIYNANKNIKIENYIYASVMNKDVPNDLYVDVIENNYEDWIAYKQLINNKPLFVINSRYDGIHNEITNFKNQNKDIELLIIIDDEVSNGKLGIYHYYSYTSAVIMITNMDKLEKKNNYENIRYLEVKNE